MLAGHLLSPQQGAVHPAKILIAFSGGYFHDSYWIIPIT